jgi:hypothetical protein
VSGRIAKAQIPLRAQATLPPDARIALAVTKNLLKAGKLPKPFRNEKGNSSLEGPPLPDPDLGHDYYEVPVGLDRAGGKGSKRFVLEVHRNTKKIAETYYTDEHYGKFSFVRVV